MADNFSYLSILNPGFSTVPNTGPLAAGTFAYVSFLNPPTGGGTIIQGGSINGSTGDISIVAGANITVSNNDSTIEIIGGAGAGGGGFTSLVGSQNVTVSTAGSSATIQGPVLTQYLTTAAQVSHSHGAVAVTNLSATSASNGLSLAAPLSYLTAGANITLSTNGSTVSIIGGAGAGGGAALQGSGTYTQNTGTIQFATANGITFGLTAGSMTASHNGLTTAMASNEPHLRAIVYSNATQTSGTLVLSGSNGITVRSGANTAIIEFDGHHMDALIPSGNGFGTGFSSMTSGTIGVNFAGGISGSQNGNNLTLSVPTSYAASNHSHAFATTTTTGSVINVATSNSAGVTIGVPPFITAGGAGGGATINGSTGDVSIVAGANITLNTAGSTISIVGPTPGGGAAPPAYFAMPAWGFGSQSNALLTNLTAISQRPVFFPFQNVGNLSFNELHFPLSRATTGGAFFDMQVGIYSFSNSSRLDSVFTTRVTYSHAATASVSGLRGFEATWASTSLSPGQYVLALKFNPGTAGTSAMNYSMMGAATGNSMLQTQLVNGTDTYHNNVNHQWLPFHGRWSTTTVSLPASVAAADILAQGNATNIPLPMYWVLGTHYA